MGRSALILIAAACLCQAQTPSPFRVWTQADGLSSSFSSSITADHAGHIQIKNVASNTFATLDGYQISLTPEAQGYGRLRSDADGNLWTFDAEGLLIHDGSGWHRYPDSDIAGYATANHLRLTAPYYYDTQWAPQPAERLEVMPLGHNSGLILFPDRLVEWQRATQQKNVLRLAAGSALEQFRDIQSASDGGFWISGEHGLAHLGKSSAPGGGVYEWKEYVAPGGFTKLFNPVEGKNGEVFVSGRNASGNGVIVHFAQGAWTQIYSGRLEVVRGWRGTDGAVWVQNGDHILKQEGGRFREIKIAPAIGRITTVLNDPKTGLWVAARGGIARYAVPLWQTPQEVQGVDEIIGSIAEDPQGRIWFAGERHLILNDHGDWRSYPLPIPRAPVSNPNSLFWLKNGELVVGPDRDSHIVLFNPATGKFRNLVHPHGSRMGQILKYAPDQAWVQVYENDEAYWHMEIFNGKDFQPNPRPISLAIRNPWIYLTAKNGDVWIGGPSALGVLRAGSFRTIEAKDGMGATGALSASETPAGTILFATPNGAAEYDGKSFRIIEKADSTRSVALDRDGWVWMSSNAGVYRTRPGRFIVNTAEDGLPGSTVHSLLVDSSGRVWAGTAQGISLFHPEADTDPPLTIVREDQNSRETPPGGEAHFVFSGVDKWKYTSGERLTFSWRLAGGSWSAFESSGSAAFHGLHAGKHQFEVRAMDRNGNIDPSPAQYRFAVLLPWYRQAVFLILTAMALLTIAFLLRLAWHHQRKMAYQSSHDPLTGLANRAVFEPELETAIVAARREKCTVGLILLDLDRFKLINDTLGHKVGDHFLQEVSRRLEKCVRKGDTLARLGGDEFVVVMPGLSSRDEAECVAERILNSLRQPYRIDTYELNSSASIGVSLFPEHGDDGATMQRLADMAMYQCKARNKDQYAFFDPRVNRIDLRAACIVELIVEALERGYLQLQYQPYQTIDGELVGLEALVRIEHPELGTISPKDFIGVAEDTGLIIKLGEWVLREACRQMAIWHREDHRQLRISVNVSTVQLSRADFAECVKGILRDSQLDPCGLTLEVTETAMTRDMGEVRAQILQLRAAGVTVALDDFGTGYSSLSLLHLLPVDYVKIDRSFIQRMGERDGGPAVVAAMIGLVHQCGFEVVAEGVESEQQLGDLKMAGADFVQGFLLGRPLVADGTQTLLDASEEVVPDKDIVVAR